MLIHSTSSHLDISQSTQTTPATEKGVTWNISQDLLERGSDSRAFIFLPKPSCSTGSSPHLSSCRCHQQLCGDLTTTESCKHRDDGLFPPLSLHVDFSDMEQRLAVTFPHSAVTISHLPGAFPFPSTLTWDVPTHQHDSYICDFTEPFSQLCDLCLNSPSIWNRVTLLWTTAKVLQDRFVNSLSSTASPESQLQHEHCHAPLGTGGWPADTAGLCKAPVILKSTQNRQLHKWQLFL